MKGQRLIIRNVNRIDNGIYICSVVIQLNPNFGRPVTISGQSTVEVDVLCKYALFHLALIQLIGTSCHTRVSKCCLPL